LTLALATGAKQRGAQIFLDTNVEKINLKNGRVHEVVTDKGTIETEVIVDAAGQWGSEIGKLVRAQPALVPMAHLYIITNRSRAWNTTFQPCATRTCMVYLARGGRSAWSPW